MALPIALLLSSSSLLSLTNYVFVVSFLFNFPTQVDIVPPPSSWKVAPQDLEGFMHLNLVIESVQIHTTAEGLLGETARIKYVHYWQRYFLSAVKRVRLTSFYFLTPAAA